MRKAMYYNLYVPGKGSVKLQVEKLLSSPRGKKYCTVIFVDKSYKPKEYVSRDEIDCISARCAALPVSTTGMLYSPSVVSSHQIYNMIWKWVYECSHPAQRQELFKLDNKIFSWSQKQQDQFILEGLRFCDIKANQLMNFADGDWPAQPFMR